MSKKEQQSRGEWYSKEQTSSKDRLPILDKAAPDSTFQYFLPHDEKALLTFCEQAVDGARDLIMTDSRFARAAQAAALSPHCWDEAKEKMKQDMKSVFRWMIEAKISDRNVASRNMEDYFDRPIREGIQSASRGSHFFTISFIGFRYGTPPLQVGNEKIEHIFCETHLASVGKEQGIPLRLKPFVIQNPSDEEVHKLTSLSNLPGAYIDNLEFIDEGREIEWVGYKEYGPATGFMDERKREKMNSALIYDVLKNAILFVPKAMTQVNGQDIPQGEIDYVYSSAEYGYRFDPNGDSWGTFFRHHRRFTWDDMEMFRTVLISNMKSGEEIQVVVPFGTYLDNVRNNSHVTAYIEIDVHCVVRLDLQTRVLQTALAEKPYSKVKVTVQSEPDQFSTMESLQKRTEVLLESIGLSLADLPSR